MGKPPVALLLAGILATAPTLASADGPSDLAACQATVASASADHVATLTDRVERCLRNVSAAVIVDGASPSEAATQAAGRCVELLRGLRNSKRPRKQADEVFDATVGAACDPAVNPALLHAEADTWTIGQRTLGAATLGSACGHFGHGGIGSFAAWRDCLRASAACQAHQAVALRWPRALEYFAALKTAIAALPADASRDDALAALTAVDAAIEGPVDDDVADVDCVAQPGVLETGRRTCLPTVESGSRSGQCPSAMPGEDAFFHAGIPLQYTDNGDGTVTDLVTGLTWEKLDDADGVHDVDFADDWNAATSTKIGQLNGSRFAGHDDWRVPNRRELESIIDLGAVDFAGGASVNAVFNTACTAGCSVTECSCTSNVAYWSSSVYQPDPKKRWIVWHGNGNISHDDKDTGSHPVRAVRGGIVQPVAATASVQAVASAEPPGAQLQACQAAASSASSKYVRAATRAIGSCLGAMSTAVAQGGSTTEQAASASAELCVSSLRRLRNSNDPAKALAEMASATIATSCDPSVNPDLGYDAADVLGVGQTSLGAGGVAESCAGYGAGESLSSVAGWKDCLLAAAGCQVRQSIALRWPRALEYTAALDAAIAALPATPATADARAALAALDKALEGGKDDDVAEVQCGAPRGLTVTGQTECDQGNGTLGACSGTEPGQDGQVRAGRPRRFVDNGDGTISDLVTGLMWEKQDGTATPAGVDFALGRWIDALYIERPPINPPAPVVSRQGLAGYGDWRLPNRRELESLVDIGGQSPAIDPIFHHDCTPGCTLDTCACTAAAPYWSSTHGVRDVPVPRSQHEPIPVWTVSFADGSVLPVMIGATAQARMVRGGTTEPVVAPGPPIALDRSVRNPWRSPCVPVHVYGYDADSSCYMRLMIETLPQHGFLIDFVGAKEGAATESAATAQCGVSDRGNVNETVFKRFDGVYCWVPFSSTFTGFDSFTYTVRDEDDNDSNTATAVIEIFEVKRPGS